MPRVCKWREQRVRRWFHGARPSLALTTTPRGAAPRSAQGEQVVPAGFPTVATRGWGPSTSSPWVPGREGLDVHYRPDSSTRRPGQ